MRTTARDRVEAFATRIVFALLGLLSPATAMDVMGRIMASLGPRLPRSRRMHRTLSLAFPELDEARRKARVRAIWHSFGRTIASIPHLPNFMAGARGAQLQVGGRDTLAALRGKAFIACGAHVGNWEAAAALPDDVRRHMVISYNAEDNPAVAELIQRYRRVTKAEFVRKEHIPRTAARTLREGNVFYFTIDQRVDQGDEISFLGLPAIASRLPARLAVKYGCPIVPVEALWLGGARYESHFHKPLWPDAAIPDPEDRAHELMIRMFREIEAIVLRHPDEWFCLKARWTSKEAAQIFADRPAAERRARELAEFHPATGP